MIQSLTFILSLSLCSISHASVGELYGISARTSALSGAGATSKNDVFSAYSNPASIIPQSNNNKERLLLGWTLLSMTPDFKPIHSVITTNDHSADAINTGNVDTDYKTSMGQAIAISYLVLPDWHKFTLSALGYVPIQQISYFNTGDSFAPEYVMYRARTQRPQVEMATALEVLPGFTLGLNLHLAFTLDATANIFLHTNQIDPSSLTFAASLKPKLGPVFGAQYQGENFSVGAVVRLPITSDAQLRIQSGTQTMGNIVSLDFAFDATSALYYDPLSIEVGARISLTRFSSLILQLDEQLWSRYQSPAYLIAPPTVNKVDAPTSIQISGGEAPSFQARNILIPHLAFESELSAFTLRAGYSYRPSIFKTLPAETNNALDPAKHQFALGLAFGLSPSVILDTHLNLHLLQSQTITKTSAGSIGAPSYEAGGKIYGGGFSLSLKL